MAQRKVKMHRRGASSVRSYVQSGRDARGGSKSVPNVVKGLKSTAQRDREMLDNLTAHGKSIAKNDYTPGGYTEGSGREGSTKVPDRAVESAMGFMAAADPEEYGKMKPGEGLHSNFRGTSLEGNKKAVKIARKMTKELQDEANVKVRGIRKAKAKTKPEILGMSE